MGVTLNYTNMIRQTTIDRIDDLEHRIKSHIAEDKKRDEKLRRRYVWRHPRRRR